MSFLCITLSAASTRAVDFSGAWKLESRQLDWEGSANPDFTQVSIGLYKMFSWFEILMKLDQILTVTLFLCSIQSGTTTYVIFGALL